MGSFSIPLFGNDFVQEFKGHDEGLKFCSVTRGLGNWNTILTKASLNCSFMLQHCVIMAI